MITTGVNEWLELCVQTIVWEPIIGRDSYGSPIYGPAQTFRGRRVDSISRVPGQGGDPDQLTQSTIWILGLPAVKYEDAVYVQGDPEPHPIVRNVMRYPDENGDLFVKVMLGA